MNFFLWAGSSSPVAFGMAYVQVTLQEIKSELYKLAAQLNYVRKELKNLNAYIDHVAERQTRTQHRSD
jgi:prefoldin subunit 5